MNDKRGDCKQWASVGSTRKKEMNSRRDRKCGSKVWKGACGGRGDDHIRGLVGKN